MPPKTRICFQFQQAGSCSYGASCKFRHKAVGGKGTDHIRNFFAQYPQFDYRPSRSSTREFYRMCDFFQWEKGDDERESAKDDFQAALVEEFNRRYGTDENDLGSWQGLCRALDLDPPETLTDCRDKLRNTHVNLVDLTDRYRTRQRVRVFNSVKELSEYTKLQGLYFPREDAKAGGLLRFLLRQIMNPPQASVQRKRLGRQR